MDILPDSGGVVEASVDVADETDEGEDDTAADCTVDMGMESILCRCMASWMVEL